MSPEDISWREELKLFSKEFNADLGNLRQEVANMKEYINYLTTQINSISKELETCKTKIKES